MKNVLCLRNPPINPLNGKAQKLPIINPFDKHGRVFFFAWASFCKFFPKPPFNAIRLGLDLYRLLFRCVVFIRTTGKKYSGYRRLYQCAVVEFVSR
jgi:hypothetical protein